MGVVGGLTVDSIQYQKSMEAANNAKHFVPLIKRSGISKKELKKLLRALEDG